MPKLTSDMRLENGKLPAFAWPGGYPLYYLCMDGGCLCPDCANGENGSIADVNASLPEWRLRHVEIHYEGMPLICDHCGQEIESAYGEPIELDNDGIISRI